METCNDTQNETMNCTGLRTAENYLHCSQYGLGGSLLARNLQITIHKLTNTIKHMLASRSTTCVLLAVQQKQNTNTRTSSMVSAGLSCAIRNYHVLLCSINERNKFKKSVKNEPERERERRVFFFVHVS